ncbi:TonB-dependent receptor [Aquimarina sediminis]|uniref:TonB-dependent receptor n=1 Tax=Aquimarina sediminis TaxID=2070536 RepID=UPI000CA06C72|nr:TonB-dependent receptor [Aquimarina sediminis]
MVRKNYLLFLLFLFTSVAFYAQGVTSGSISGVVSDINVQPIGGANVIAEHVPSGTRYGTITNFDGEFRFPSVRIGGPYKVSITYLGFKDSFSENITISLGETYSLNVTLYDDTTQLEDVIVTANSNSIISSSATGATSKFNSVIINHLPNLDRSTEGFLRLTPQAGSNGFLGQSNKQNFVTVDGASFNNAFGLGGANLLPGGNTNAQPISIEAIQQVQVSLSPFDVRQAGFTGTGINTVTKSGENEFHGSVYSFYRNEGLMGYKVEDEEINKTKVLNIVSGVTIGGPIIKDKLFFFANYETARNTAPAVTTIAGRNGLSGDNVSSIQASTLDAISGHLVNQYGYNPGRYEGYDRETDSDKFLIKLDWNINDHHKASIRYSQLQSSLSHVDVGFGNTSVNFENFGWTRNLDTYSIVGELNSTLSGNVTNRFFISYNDLPEYREPQGGQVAPFTIINDNGLRYTLGTHPAALGNRVNQRFLQIQNDVSWFLNKNKITAGVSYEQMNFKNEFTLFNNGFYIFNSLDSFYNNAVAGTAIPTGTSTGTGQPALFQYRYPLDESKIATATEPKFSQLGFYVQDEIDVNENFRVTAGVRLDVTSFLNDPGDNTTVSSLSFQDPDGNIEQYSTSKLPDSKLLVSPRLGFNWKLLSNRLQIRGGTGIFTGRVPFVFIEKQFSQNGLVEGELIELNFDGANTNIQNFPYTADVSQYRPSSSAPIPNFTLALVDPDFKMPQVWRSDVGLDYRLPGNVIASADFIYSKDINAPYYRNVNLDHTNPGADANGRYVFSDNRINDNITGAYVLDNTNKGYAYSITGKLEKQFSNNWSASLAYSYNEAKNVNDLNSSLPDRAYDRNPVVGNGDLEVLSNSLYGPRHNIIGSASYIADWADWTSTTFSLFFKGTQDTRFSYTYSGSDVNGDGSNRNDLIFVPENANDINLVQNGDFTPQEQWQALDRFIENSDYLSSVRGQFAERNGLELPTYFQMDFKLLQDFNLMIQDKEHKLQLSWDVFNLTNLLNNDWGIIKTPRTTTPINAVSATEFTVNPTLLSESEFINNTSELSRWRMQLGLKYSF